MKASRGARAIAEHDNFSVEYQKKIRFVIDRLTRLSATDWRVCLMHADARKKRMLDVTSSIFIERRKTLRPLRLVD